MVYPILVHADYIIPSNKDYDTTTTLTEYALPPLLAHADYIPTNQTINKTTPTTRTNCTAV
jgi:hypothetical protein